MVLRGDFSKEKGKAESRNSVVENAIAAKNSAYTDFQEFKFFKNCAMHELSNASIEVEKCARTLENDYRQSLARATKPSEKELIETCFESAKQL